MNRVNGSEVTIKRGIINKLEFSLPIKYLGLAYAVGKKINYGYNEKQNFFLN